MLFILYDCVFHCFVCAATPAWQQEYEESWDGPISTDWDWFWTGPSGRDWYWLPGGPAGTDWSTGPDFGGAVPVCSPGSCYSDNHGNNYYSPTPVASPAPVVELLPTDGLYHTLYAAELDYSYFDSEAVGFVSYMTKAGCVERPGNAFDGSIDGGGNVKKGSAVYKIISRTKDYCGFVSVKLAGGEPSFRQLLLGWDNFDLFVKQLEMRPSTFEATIGKALGDLRWSLHYAGSTYGWSTGSLQSSENLGTLGAQYVGQGAKARKLKKMHKRNELSSPEQKRAQVDMAGKRWCAIEAQCRTAMEAYRALGSGMPQASKKLLHDSFLLRVVERGGRAIDSMNTKIYFSQEAWDDWFGQLGRASEGCAGVLALPATNSRRVFRWFVWSKGHPLDLVLEPEKERQLAAFLEVFDELESGDNLFSPSVHLAPLAFTRSSFDTYYQKVSRELLDDNLVLASPFKIRKLQATHASLSGGSKALFKSTATVHTHTVGTMEGTYNEAASHEKQSLAIELRRFQHDARFHPARNTVVVAALGTSGPAVCVARLVRQTSIGCWYALFGQSGAGLGMTAQLIKAPAEMVFERALLTPDPMTGTQLWRNAVGGAAPLSKLADAGQDAAFMVASKVYEALTPAAGDIVYYACECKLAEVLSLDGDQVELRVAAEIQHPDRSLHQAFYRFTAHDEEVVVAASGVIFPLDLEFHGPGMEGMEAVFQLRKGAGMACV